MDKHTADGLLKRFLFWQRETQIHDGDDHRIVLARFRGFVEAVGMVLEIDPCGSEAGDAIAVFDRLRGIARGPSLDS